MPVILSLLFGIVLGQIFIYFPLTVTLVSLVIFLSFLKRNKFLAILIVLSLVSGISYSNHINSNKQQKFRDITAIGYIKNANQNIYNFRIVESNKTELKNTNLKVYSRETLQEGKSYLIECVYGKTYKNPYQSENPICYVKNTQLLSKSYKTRFDELRGKINTKIEETISENLSGSLIAMTTGERVSIPDEIKDDFRKTGLIHILSISGAHFSLLFTIFFIVFKFIFKRLPYKLLVRLTIYIKPSQLSILFCFPVILGYYLIVEPNYPSTRSFIMATLFMTGVLSERKSIWIFTVSFACLIILIFQPDAIKDVSFQLSFLATAGIGFISDIYKHFKGKIHNKVLAYILLSFLVSVSATLITAPVIIYKFHYLSLIGSVANLTAGLLIGMVLFPLHICFVAFFLITGTYPLPELIDFIGTVSFKLMHVLASFNYSSILIPPVSQGVVVIFYLSIFIVLLSYYCFKGKLMKLCYGLSILLFFSSILIPIATFIKEKENLKMTFLDVGQADSTVLETPSGVFLIDTGKTGWEITQFLRAKGINEINALIITHEQKDHAGGFERVIKNFKLNEIWDNGYIEYNKQILPDKIVIRHLARGDILQIDNCSFTVLHPYSEFWTSSLSRDSNELSLIFKFKCFNKNYLFTSDAGKQSIKTLPVQYLKTDIVKIPHHGSKYSLLREFYDHAKPEFCIISTGKDNPYGHPHSVVITALEKHCNIFRTDNDGAIQIKEKKDGTLTIQTMKSLEFKPYRDWENLKKLFILW